MRGLAVVAFRIPTLPSWGRKPVRPCEPQGCQLLIYCCSALIYRFNVLNGGAVPRTVSISSGRYGRAPRVKRLSPVLPRRLDDPTKVLPYRVDVRMRGGTTNMMIQTRLARECRR